MTMSIQSFVFDSLTATIKKKTAHYEIHIYSYSSKFLETTFSVLHSQYYIHSNVADWIFKYNVLVHPYWVH